MPAGLPKVEVTFLDNADGILTVRAKELRSGVAQSIEVKPQYGLTDAEVEKMLMESITHAKDDIRIRALVEAQTEALQILETTRQFIQRNTGFLTDAELADTEKAMEELTRLREQGTKHEIQAGVGHLNDISRPYAERLMDTAVAAALKDKAIK